MAGDGPAPQVFEGRYEMHSRIGEGSFGVVYRVRDRLLGREVALKILKPRKDDSFPHVLARFRREVELLVRFPHPALVPVLDAHLEPPRPYLVSTWMAGGDLRRWIREGPRPAAEVARIGARLAEALGHLHGHGVLHRDVKPGNVFLDDAGEVYLADLGLGSVQGDARLTGTGEVVGTPHYMAPELFLTATPLPASDLFALGAVLLEVLQGATLDGAARDPAALKLRLDTVRPAPLRAVLRRCLRTDPEGRPSSGQELAEALRACYPDEAGAVAAGHASQAIPPLGASKALQAPSLRRGWPWLVGFGLVVAGWGVTRTAEPPPPASAPPPGFPSPLEAGFEEGLLEELDQALEAPPESSDSQEPRTLVQRLSLQGFEVLQELPLHHRALTWLAAHRGVAELPPRTLAALRRDDQAFLELGFPPPFRPFLDACPWSRPAPPAPELPALDRTVLAFLTEAADVPADPWLRAARMHLVAALEQAERIRRRLGSREETWDGLPPEGVLLMRAVQNIPNVGLGTLPVPLRTSEEGREIFRRLLAAGREPARDYLLAAERVVQLRGEGLPPGILDGLLHGVGEVQEFFTGTLVTASAEQLFGAGDGGEPGLLLRVRLLDHLRNSQLLSFLRSGSSGEQRVRLLQAAVAACRQAGFHGHASWLWPKLVSALRAEERPEELLEVSARDELVVRRFLDPGWVAGELEGHKSWARAALERGR